MTTLGVFRDDFYNPTTVLPQSVINSTTQNGGTLTAANMVGGTEVYIFFSGQTTAQSITTDTAANIIAALKNILPNVQGNVSYFIQMVNNNTSSGAITLTGGTGVTITGTNTLAISTNRQFNVQITSPTTITLTNVGSGTN